MVLAREAAIAWIWSAVRFVNEPMPPAALPTKVRSKVKVYVLLALLAAAAIALALLAMRTIHWYDLGA